MPVLCKMFVAVQGQPKPLILLSLTFAWRSFVMDGEELAGSVSVAVSVLSRTRWLAAGSSTGL